MKFILWFLYSTGVRIGSLYIYFGRYFSKKLALLYQGREDNWQKLTTFSSDHKESIWVHCASLGEFEQGRPLIESIRKDFPGIPLVLSFFSPSGYEIRKNYAFADLIIYLPADLDVHNQRLIELINPSMVIFVKYEFWWNLIRLLVTNHVNVYLISGVFREKDYFFNPLLRPFKALLCRYTKIYVQDETSATVLLSNGISNFEVAGDTRIDSVMVRSKFAALPDRITKYVENKKVIIYGSIWTSDMKVVGPLFGRYTDFIHIIAPHDVSDDNIVAIKKMLNQTSSTYTDDQWDSNILIINNIGMLSGLYSIAKYAYIGGGFDKGIHNTLEPAVFGIPVFFGPKYSKFTEATRMIEIEIAFSVSEPEACIRWIDTLESDVNKYMKIRDKSDHFFASNSGATQKIVSDLYPFLSR
jgi:3-deoxy-D-manno-octulosonic-acid transferase